MNKAKVWIYQWTLRVVFDCEECETQHDVTVTIDSTISDFNMDCVKCGHSNKVKG